MYHCCIRKHSTIALRLNSLFDNPDMVSKVGYEPTPIYVDQKSNSMVILEKPNGKLRICLDPSDLNKATKRHHHLLTTEEILSKLSNAKVFTKLDASCGYWQIPVDADSSKLLTFNTPFGRHRFKKMPYGLHSASEVF